MNPQRPLIRDLDSIPHEDWLDVEHHFELAAGTVRRKKEFAFTGSLWSSRSRGAYVFSLRGCAFECSYCVHSRLKQLYPGQAYLRKRSIAPVIERVEQLRRADPSLDMLYFYEDDFFVRTEDEIDEFARQWKKRIDLPFYANCTPMTLNERKLAALTDAGLRVVSMGIQTGSERVNFEMYGRKVRNGSVLRAAALLRGYLGKGRFGLLPPWYDLIINNPYETEDDLLETVAVLRQLPKPFSVGMPSLVFQQATRLYGKALADGIIAGADDSARFNYCDTLRHFGNLVKRGGNLYLNSLLYWMNGDHTGRMYGAVPAALLGPLTRGTVIRFFNRHPFLVTFLNYAIPTRKRRENIREKARRFLSDLAERAGGKRNERAADREKEAPLRPAAVGDAASGAR